MRSNVARSLRATSVVRPNVTVDRKAYVDRYLKVAPFCRAEVDVWSQISNDLGGFLDVWSKGVGGLGPMIDV